MPNSGNPYRNTKIIFSCPVGVIGVTFAPMTTLQSTWFRDVFMLLSGLIVLIIAFGDILPHPNDYLLGGGLDGWKNYFTPSWYVKFDSGFGFSGMNYPFGEHVLYTDNQPVIAAIIGFFHRNIFPVSDYVVGILNTLVFASLLGTMFLVYKIESKLGIAWWMAIPGALLIGMMSPQIHRFSGHYALAYTIVIPAIWYGVILILEDLKKWWRPIVLSLVMLLMAWVHAYYLLMGLLLTMSFSLIHLLQNFKKERVAAWKGAAFLAGSGIVALILFQIILLITDTVGDRPANPFGFLDYRASWNSVFLPIQGPLYDAWHRFARYVKPVPVEGFAYVGAVATIIGMGWLTRLGKYGFRKRWRRITHPVLPEALRVSFWASFLVLLFSMAIPFQWFSDGILELLGPLRQFRSLGRFAWIFYYPFTVLAVYTLYQVYRSLSIKGSKTIAIWMLLAAAGFWTLEMSIHVKLHADGTRNHLGDNVFINQEPDFNAWLAEAGVSPDEFQALLPIPSFNVGSEKYVSRWQNGPTTARAFKMAYNLGLPLACGMMSRTSIDESNKLVQLMSAAVIQKDIIAEYPDDRPILVLSQAEVPISWEEQQLLTRTEILIEKGAFSLRRLKLEDLATDPDLTIAQFEALRPALDTIAPGWLGESDSTWYYFDGFDKNGPSEFGSEIQTCSGDEIELSLYHGKLPNEKLVASMWVKIDHTVAGFPAFVIREFDENDEMIRDEAHGIMFGMNVYEDWLRFDFEFTPMENSERVHICLYDRKPQAESFLIRRVGEDVYSDAFPGHRLMKNNFYVE